MTYPTPEEIDQLATECGIDFRKCEAGELATCYASELQAFFLRGIEMGRKRALVDISRDLQAIQEDGSCLCASCAQHVTRITGKAIRNNTGE